MQSFFYVKKTQRSEHPNTQGSTLPGFGAPWCGKNGPVDTHSVVLGMVSQSMSLRFSCLLTFEMWMRPTLETKCRGTCILWGFLAGHNPPSTGRSHSHAQTSPTTRSLTRSRWRWPQSPPARVKEKMDAVAQRILGCCVSLNGLRWLNNMVIRTLIINH